MFKRDRSRPQIPMHGSGVPPVVPPSRPSRLASISKRLFDRPAVTLPVILVVVLVLVGVLMPSTGGSDGVIPGTGPNSTVEDTAGSSQSAGSGVWSELIVDSIVQIVVLEDGLPCASGSGSVIGDSLHVLTNYHVVEDDPDCKAEALSVRTVRSASSLSEETHTAVVAAFDKRRDIAILKLTPTSAGSPRLVPLPLVTSDKIGLDIALIGFPAIGGDSPTVSKGIISGFTTFDGVQWIKTDALLSGGNSGGAALDQSGRLLGIPTMYSESPDGELIDCRKIADTNGDGTVDDQDQCVSVGGTIGLIAPVTEAIEVARRAGVTLQVSK